MSAKSKSNAHSRAMKTAQAMKKFINTANMNGPAIIPGQFVGAEAVDPDLGMVDVDGEIWRFIPRGTPTVPTVGDIVLVVNFPGVAAFIGWVIKGDITLADQGDF